VNERIEKLREQSVRTKPALSSERAELLTKFEKSDAGKKFLTKIDNDPESLEVKRVEKQVKAEAKRAGKRIWTSTGRRSRCHCPRH